MQHAAKFHQFDTGAYWFWKGPLGQRFKRFTDGRYAVEVDGKWRPLAESEAFARAAIDAAIEAAKAAA